MVKTRRELRDWLKESGLTHRAFARAHGFSAALLSQWLTGHRNPGLPSAIKLERITGIPAASWVSRRRSNVSR